MLFCQVARIGSSVSSLACQQPRLRQGHCSWVVVTVGGALLIVVVTIVRAAMTGVGLEHCIGLALEPFD